MPVGVARRRRHARSSIRVALARCLCPRCLAEPGRLPRCSVVRLTCLHLVLAENGGDRWANSVRGGAGGLTARFLLRGRRHAVALRGKRDGLGSVNRLRPLVLFVVCRALGREHECLHVCLPDDPVSGEAQLSVGLLCLYLFLDRALVG